mmetsp:Transcript_4407/g.7486  ORF Transcript_4407/g.7486 Transcript_4407/m.7486 type:complete len:102 (+) Transcript_4407:1945-2250(+)
MKYSVLTHSFLTDGIPDYPHFAPIKKMAFIQRLNTGIAQIGVLDEMGVLSMWSVLEVSEQVVTDYELNMSLGSKFKMVLSFSDNLLLYPNVIDYTDFSALT